MPRFYRSKKKNSARTKRRRPTKKNFRRRRYTGNMVISRPLLPQTQKVGMRYTTRLSIDPAAAESGITDSAHNLVIHTLAWNNLYDPDLTATAVHSSMEGARNHQPRMYDQYATFYNKATVIGAKAKLTFSSSVRKLKLSTYASDGTSVTGFHDVIEPPIPCYVGYLNSSYADTAVPLVKMDDMIEQKHAVMKKLTDPQKPQTLIAKWSLNKEPSRRSRLQLESSQMSDDWGALFNHTMLSSQQRHLHLFAHPITTIENLGFKDPAPIDVAIEMDFIVVLSDRKEVTQS